MPFTDPIIQNPATNAHEAVAVIAGDMYQGIQYFPAGIYTISCVSTTITVANFYSGVTLIATATTSSGTVNVNLASDCDSVQFYTDTGSNVNVIFTLIGSPISPVNDLGKVKSIITGGTLTSDSTYYYRTFTASGSLGVTASYLGFSCDVLVVAGGGGGLTAGAGLTAGGGGAGGIFYVSNLALATGTQSITVGNGGAVGVAGQNSVFGGLTPAVGGAAGGATGTNGTAGGSGSGGGSGATTGGSSNQSSTGGTGYGNAGGSGITGANGNAGGGGGGAGAVGANATATAGGGGGNGTNAFSAWLTATGMGVGGYIAGGGAGGLYLSSGTGTLSSGGLGGGGSGGDYWSGAVQQYGTAGAANTGGGGGSFGLGAGGFAGGSGLVIVRYLKTAV